MMPLGDLVAMGLIGTIAIIFVLALIGLYARRLWALPTHSPRKRP